MKLDDEQQRKALLQIVIQPSYSGESLEYMEDLVRKIVTADLEQNRSTEDFTASEEE